MPRSQLPRPRPTDESPDPMDLTSPEWQEKFRQIRETFPRSASQSPDRAGVPDTPERD